jgi:hypothetical protein
VVVLALVWRVRATGSEDRRRDARVLAIGAVAGIVATLTYDAAKVVLSQADPSPYNPFEALRVFGSLLLGATAEPLAVPAPRTAFHLLNGTCFGIAYTFLFGPIAARTRRSALVSGMAWGLFLETFQLTLYPGWLDIRFYQEFATISALSHLVYGATLGLLVRFLIGRNLDRQIAAPGRGGS